MLIALLLSCAPWPLLTGDDVCVEVQTAVAVRTLACGGDDQLAEERYLAITESFDCRWAGTEVDEETSNLRVEDMTECVAAIEATPCSDVQEYGDDPSYWISLSDRCAWLYDGAEVPVDRFRTEGS